MRFLWDRRSTRLEFLCADGQVSAGPTPRPPERSGFDRARRCQSRTVRCDSRRDWAARRTAQGAVLMLDVIMLAIGLGFFALTIAYAFGCDRL